MGDFNEDDIPDGQDKETYMFEADKNREALLFSFQLASLDFSNYEKFKVEIEGKDVCHIVSFSTTRVSLLDS